MIVTNINQNTNSETDSFPIYPTNLNWNCDKNLSLIITRKEYKNGGSKKPPGMVLDHNYKKGICADLMEKPKYKKDVDALICIPLV